MNRRVCFRKMVDAMTGFSVGTWGWKDGDPRPFFWAGWWVDGRVIIKKGVNRTCKTYEPQKNRVRVYETRPI